MASYDEILSGIKENTKKVNSLKLSDYEKAAKKSLESDRKAEQKNINDTYDSTKKNTQATYDSNLADTKTAYESNFQKNAVQKIINEKKVAETNASLGLTDSGLNRTQQTAVQLSYANQKGALNLARQKAIDNIALSLSSALTDIENNRNSALLASNQKWDNEARSMAQTNYSNDVTMYTDKIASGYEQLLETDKTQEDNNSKTQSNSNSKTSSNSNSKAQSNTSYKSQNNDNAQKNAVFLETQGSRKNYIIQTPGGLLTRDYYGTLKDNNVDVINNGNGTFTYVDNNSGNKTTLSSGTNPYTGTRNKDIIYGTFSNGYQPNNIGGVKLKKVDDVEISVKGNPQSVFYANGVYYVWDGANNQYHMLTRKQVYNLGLNE